MRPRTSYTQCETKAQKGRTRRGMTASGLQRMTTRGRHKLVSAIRSMMAGWFKS
jgi:hypothetical protein